MSNFTENKNKNIAKIRNSKSPYKLLGLCQSLEEVTLSLVSYLSKIHASKKIVYVSGIITSDGQDFIKRNIRNLKRHTKDISCGTDSHVFSAVDALTSNVIENLRKHNHYTEEHYRVFWKTILESKVIDSIVMTPGWSRSSGAIIEYRTALSEKIEILFIDDCAVEVVKAEQ